MNINDIYGGSSNYLKVADLNGHKPVVEIESYSVETLRSEEGEKKQVVITFKGKDKRLGLNKTNAQRIAKHTGSEDPDEWIGCKIKLIPSTTNFQGREVECIRVSEEYFEPAPSKKSAGIAPDDSEVPF